MPTVQLDYRTMCKNLSVEMIPKVWNGVEPDVFEGNTTKNPHEIAPAVMAVHED